MNKLDCWIVRDLLPSYLEDLTEPQTTAMVRAHLDDCPDCRAAAQRMRSTMPVERVPKRELKFLRQIKRTRLIAALLSILAALLSMWWLYDQAFCYPNTEAGRLAAVSDYISLPESPGESADTPLRVVSWQTRDDRLFLFFRADNAEHVHGVIHLARGINGKYRTLQAIYGPSAYTAGLYSHTLAPQGTDWQLCLLAGDSCREIYTAQVQWIGLDTGDEAPRRASATYEIPTPDFLWIMDQDELARTLGLPTEDLINLRIESVRLFDRDGQDITAQFYDPEMTASWNSGTGTAETGLLYFALAAIALLCAVFVRYFLRAD